MYILKGQLISKCPFAVIFLTKTPTIFLRIPALASKKKKIKTLYSPLFIFDYLKKILLGTLLIEEQGIISYFPKR